MEIKFGGSKSHNSIQLDGSVNKAIEGGRNRLLVLSCVFCLVLAWLSYGCGMVSVGFPHGFRMVVVWLSPGCCMVIGWLSHGVRLVFVMFSSSFRMVAVCLSYGFRMVFVWFCVPISFSLRMGAFKQPDYSTFSFCSVIVMGKL